MYIIYQWLNNLQNRNALRTLFMLCHYNIVCCGKNVTSLHLEITNLKKYHLSYMKIDIIMRCYYASTYLFFLFFFATDCMIYRGSPKETFTGK